MVDMKDYNGYSDDELLDELDYLSLELSCLIGTEEGDTVEKMFWMVMREVERRGIIVDEEEEKERGMVDSLREDKTEEKGNFGFGRDYEDDGYGDLPF
tara:strand:+ start:667 stop:960 length:294 start_codon:yes stop_codon:yes gene_type:complete